MNESNRKGAIIGILIAAILPLSLYFIMRSLHDGHIALPGYYRIDGIGMYEKDGVKYSDTTFHQTKDLVLVNQLGDTVSLNETLKGKVLAVNFMFTTCQSVCPQITMAVYAMQKAYEKKNPDWVHFISISVDPERDTVGAIRAYADNFKVNHDRWFFLTGSKEAIYNFAKEELGVVLQPNDGAEGMVHSENVILLDKDRYIRGYYNALNVQEMSKCVDDIAVLQLEKKRR
jgi:protein SCO1/2